MRITFKLGKKIKGFLLLPVAFILVILLRFPAVAATARHYTELQFSPLPEIQIPQYQRYQLGNGMIVYLMEDRELPLIGGTALIRTGDRFESNDKVGLGGIVGEVMRTGGTTQHPADELNQLLEQRAASIETGIGTTSGSASFSALSEDLDTVFSLFSEVIQTPLFPPEKIEFAKSQQRGGIARRNDDPNSIAGREFQKLIYGGDSPYARTVEYATLDKITREDCLNFYQQYVQPNNIILGIVGDFDSNKIRQLIEDKFGNWETKATPSSNLPTVMQKNKGGVFFINQPQLTQSYIQMGHLGGQRNSPDYIALSVMNEVMNGFGGRLFNSVRSRQGLAYTVYGYWNAQFDFPGTFVAGGQTQSQSTVPFIQAVTQEIERLRTTPITAQELAYAKESVLNSFVFNFQNPSQTLSRLMRYEYYGYPSDFIFRYQKGVETTTIQDVQRVANKYLQPDQIVTLVVGNQDAIQPTLSSLSKQVTSVDISIPPSGNS